MKTPPFYADTFGVLDVVGSFGGAGIIDDSSGYHPFNGKSGLAATGIRMEDVITGTQEKILSTFRKQVKDNNPPFVLLCAAPCASMIATDMESACHIMEEECGAPCMVVDISGHKPYDNGVSKSYEAIAKRMVEPSDTHDGSINILGFNSLDMSDDIQESVCDYVCDVCDSLGVRINAIWGYDELDKIKASAAASLNVVVSVSGIAAAKYMEKNFGVPYAVISPYGTGFETQLSAALSGNGVETVKNSGETPEVIIVGEQVASNAIRQELLRNYGYKNVRVVSYFTMEKTLMQDGDKRTKNEDVLEKAIAESGARVVIADPVLSALVPDGVRLVPLPSGTYIWKDGEMPDLTGDRLNEWLEEEGL